VATRGRLRHAPYPVAVVLAGAVDGDNWHIFDGWCAARGVDPRGLGWSRFLNLVYFFLLENNDKEGRAKVEQAIANAQAQWTRRLVHDTLRRPTTRTVDPSSHQWDALDHLLHLEETRQQEPSGRARRLPAPPDWWHGDQDAARSSMIAAQQLRRRG
jgi:hypothetical protein